MDPLIQPRQSRTLEWPDWRFVITAGLVVVLYVLLFFLQFNQPPLERYGNWDIFWTTAVMAGKLLALKEAFAFGELPALNPFVGLDWNQLGDTSLPQSPFNPLNLLIFFMSPDQVILIRTALLMIMGGLGASLYLRFITGDRLMSLLGGLMYISLPYVIGLFFYYNISTMFYLLPFFLLMVHALLECVTVQRLLLFALLSIFAFSCADVYILFILPPSIGFYAFFVALTVIHSSFMRSLVFTMGLTALFLLAGAFYIIPLLYNLHDLSIALSALQEAGLAPLAKILPSPGASMRSFWEFFQHYCLPTFYLPNEGTGATYYVPVFLLIGIIFALVWRRRVFAVGSAALRIVLVLVGLVGMIYIVTMAYYAIPALAAKGHGTLRYHLNIFPFVMVLAGVIVFSSMNRVQDGRGHFYLFVGLVALLVDIFLFVGRAFPVDFYWFTLSPCVINNDFPCSNRVGVRFLDNMWPALPALNLLWLVLFYAAGATAVRRPWQQKGMWILICAGLLILPLLNISIHNELKRQQSGWQLLSRTTFFWNSFQSRRAEIDRLIGCQDPNYRTLPCSADVFRMGRGRNWKLLADTELGMATRQKILFSYRETMHPYAALLYSTFDTHFIPSNWFPPLSNRVADNLPILKLMGVRWVLSADAAISHPDLICRGQWIADKCPFHETAADGTVYLYEVRKPLGIVFLAHEYRLVNRLESLRTIAAKSATPWLNGVVYLEQLPEGNDTLGSSRSANPSPLSDESAHIEKESFNRIEVRVLAPKPQWLVLSYIHRPSWKAYLDDKPIPVYRAYGGFMCVPVPSGKSTVVLKYTPWDVYAGLGGSVLAFVLPFSFGWWQRRRHRLGFFLQRGRIGLWVGGLMTVAVIGYGLRERTRPEYWVKRGEVLTSVGRYGAASDCFLKALAKGRQSAVVYRRLSECFEAQEQWEHAVDYSLRWTCLEPDNSRAWLTLGRCCYGAERYDLAAEAFAKADRLQPDCAEACKGWAMSEYARRKYTSALPLLRRWIRLDPDDGNAQRLVGLILARPGHDISGSIPYLTAAIHSGQLKQDDQVGCLAVLGISELSLGNLEKGQRYFEQAEQFDPDWMRVLTVDEQRTARKAIEFGIDTARRKVMASVLFSLNRNNVTSLISSADNRPPEFVAGETSPAASLAWALDSPAALVALNEVRRYRLSFPPSSINLTSGTFTVWARLSDTSQAYSALLAVNDTAPLYVYRRGGNGTFVFKYNGNSTTFTPPSAAILGITNWHHYAVTWADGEQRLSIDGVVVCSMNERAATCRTERVCAGWNGLDDNEQWNGPIWNFTTFARALEAREVAALVRADIQDTVSAADAAWSAGEYDQAIAGYQLAAGFHRTRPDLFLKMATYYDRVGQRTEAVRWYERWAFSARDHVEGMATLGMVYLGIKNYPMAASTFDRLLEREPGNVAFIRDAGISAFGSGAYSRAADLLTTWAMGTPGSFAANLLAGTALERSKETGLPEQHRIGAALQRDYLKQALSLADRRFVLDVTSLNYSNGEYYVKTPEGWTVTISGPCTLAELPDQIHQAIRIHDTPKATRIYGPVEAVALKQGMISVWARLNNPSKRYMAIVAVYSANGSRCLYVYRTAEGRIKMRVNETEVASRAATVTDGNWHHYAITWGDGEQAVYVDGERVLSGYWQAPPGKVTRLAIGWLGDGDTEQWDGWIAAFEVSGKALVKDDVAALALADAALYQRRDLALAPP